VYNEDPCGGGFEYLHRSPASRRRPDLCVVQKKEFLITCYMCEMYT
jgi:hypothetical protein